MIYSRTASSQFLKKFQWYMVYTCMYVHVHVDLNINTSGCVHGDAYMQHIYIMGMYTHLERGDTVLHPVHWLLCKL